MDPGGVRHWYLSNPVGKKEARPFTPRWTHHDAGLKEIDRILFLRTLGSELEKRMFPTLLLGSGLILDKSLDLLECQFPHLLKRIGLPRLFL